LKRIETLIEDGGTISVGALEPFNCVASAANEDMCLVMLVRREGEALGALLKRLDRSIGLAWSDGIFIDEVNRPQDAT
jgi:hypothetical protein